MSPHPHPLAGKLFEANFEILMELGYPALAPMEDRLIIDACVADEHVTLPRVLSGMDLMNERRGVRRSERWRRR